MRGRRKERVFGAVARHWLSERRCQRAGCARASPGGLSPWRGGEQWRHGALLAVGKLDRDVVRWPGERWN